MDGIIPSNPVASLATAYNSRVMGDLESRIEKVNRAIDGDVDAGEALA